MSTTSRRRFLKSVGSTSLGGILGRIAGAAAHGGAQARPPNILLLMCDQLRSDGTGYAGNRFAVTPVLDKLAGSGVVFSRTYCQNPLCVPSRTSLLLGRYCRSTGVMANQDLPYRDQVSFTQVLREAGFKTACFGKLHVQDRNDLDWDVVDDSRPSRGGARGGGRRVRGGRRGRGARGGVDTPEPETLVGTIPVGRPAPFDEESHPELHDMRHTIAFMEENRREPWFIQCSFRKPHPPFLPPQRQWDRIDRSSLSIPRYPDDDLDDVNPILWRRPNGASRAGKLDDEIVLDAMQGYYASLAYCDELFGQVLGVLDHLGLREDTIVVFTSDHGEMLYDHRLWSKSNFFEQSVHVPLILSWPGRLEAGTSAALAEHVDLFPTFMDLAGLETPESVQGRSLAPVLQGETESIRDLVHSERRGGITMQFDGRWKFIDNGEGAQHELYDLQEDPREITNLAMNDEYSDRVRDLESELNAWKEVDAVPRRSAGGGRRRRRGRRGRGRQ